MYDSATQRAAGSASTTPEDVTREHFRYPVGFVTVRHSAQPGVPGFYRFGGATYFGNGSMFDGGVQADVNGEKPLTIPFDVAEAVTNLRFERYVESLKSRRGRLFDSTAVRQTYYGVREFLPIAIRRHLQRLHLADWKRIGFPAWPVDTSVETLLQEVLAAVIRARRGSAIPFIWFWPDRCSGVLMLTHDVERKTGRDFCTTLMDIDENAGFRSSFHLIPEGRYEVPRTFIEEVRRRGHEINVHDLNHDGHLYRDRKEFLLRARKLSAYRREFGAGGFRSGALYRNLDWYSSLDFEYDMSVPNTAHLDPQRGGCCTVMPYFVGNILELPLTTTQDYSLFHILGQNSLELWEQQIRLIRSQHGLISFNIHPDYIREPRRLALYRSLLTRLAVLRDESRLWAALPGEINQWWRQRSRLELVPKGSGWRIEGEGSSRARLAWANVSDGRLVYTVE